jgi:hypothetical protein
MTALISIWGATKTPMLCAEIGGRAGSICRRWITMISTFGPIHPEAADMDSHRPLRDSVAALEKKLADGLVQAGHDVLNKVSCRRPLDPQFWPKICAAFQGAFPNLKI